MKHLLKFNINENYDHFDEISPEQAYKELEDELSDLPNNEDIKDDIESIFEFIKEDGLDPYEMTFDEFYTWASSKFRLEYPKSSYKQYFLDKKYIKNPNQQELPFKENLKYLISAEDYVKKYNF